MAELGGEMEARKATMKADEATKDEPYAKAKNMDLEGRSDMTEDELAAAVANAEA